jgi:hypothetical protein
VGLSAFTFDANLIDAFVRLPYVLHARDPRFVPPLEADVRAQLSEGFWFHGRSGHAHRCFLACAGGRPVARALASCHPQLADRDGTPVGAIGFYESGDAAAGQDVLAAAVAWLGEQGRSRIWGPLNFDTWHGYRFMVRGFSSEPHLFEPRNPPEYPEHWERFGFRRRRAWNSFAIGGGRAAMDSLAAPGAAPYADCLRRGFRFAPYGDAGSATSLTELHGAIEAAFSGFLGFTPLAAPAFHALARSAVHALEPACSTFVRDPAGRLVAFHASFVDVAAALRAMRGRSSWAARARFSWHRRRARRLMLHLGGITVPAGERPAGLAAAVVHHALATVRARGYEDVLVTLVAEGNPLRRLYAPWSADTRREYALYEWSAA